MGRLSKDDRKRLRREAEESARRDEFFSHVISQTATQSHASPEQIVADAARVAVAIEHRPIDDISHAFGIPGEDNQFLVVVGYGQLSRDILAEAESYEWLFEDVQKLRLGLPTITFRAKVNLDPVVAFLHLTLVRVLGRLTHGSMICGMGRQVCDDWLAWSLDYEEPDMFKMASAYEERPSLSPLLYRFPALRAAKP